MANSRFQDYHGDALKRIFREHLGIDFISEMPCGDGCRIDLGTSDMKYGIEIKSNITDLKSGYGLNQDKFCWGYVVAPRQLMCQTVGYLYMRGMERAGVIGIAEDDSYYLAKPAHGKPGIGQVSVSAIICDIGDEIQRLFYEKDACHRLF